MDTKEKKNGAQENNANQEPVKAFSIKDCNIEADLENFNLKDAYQSC